MKKEQNLNYFDLFTYLRDRYKWDKHPAVFMANEQTYDEVFIKFPIRNFVYGIGLSYAGEPGRVLIGSREYQTKAGSLITIGPGIVSQWQPNRNQKNITFFFTEELFKRNIQYTFLTKLLFFMPGGDHVIQLNDQQASEVKNLLDLARTFIADRDVVAGLLYAVLMLAEKFHELQPKSNNNANAHNEKITDSFHSILIQKFLSQKEVSFYAEQLNVSAKHLSDVLLTTTGKTAKQLISDILFLEARSLLRQTDMSVQEISDWLGYEDASYFTKAFKKNEGLTPTEYRKL